MKNKILGGIIVLLFVVYSSVGTFAAAYSLKLCIVAQIGFKSEVYHTNPDWISDNPDYSTGAALADLNRDGWLDLIVADGNDMDLGYLNVYYNNGNGGFPTTASWQSDDIK